MLDVTHKSNTSKKLPIYGYFFSLILLFTVFFIVTKTHMVRWALVFFVIGLAAVQTLIQLLTFLNLGIESKPRWGIMTALFTLMVIIIIFGGSIWIMKTINYNMMP